MDFPYTLRYITIGTTIGTTSIIYISLKGINSTYSIHLQLLYRPVISGSTYLKYSYIDTSSRLSRPGVHFFFSLERNIVQPLVLLSLAYLYIVVKW